MFSLKARPSEARKYLEKASSSTSIWPEFRNNGGGDSEIRIRQPQQIKVQFTPREFPTPARESSAHLEEEVSEHMMHIEVKVK